MTAEEFGGWQAFYRVEPFGPRQADERAGMITAMLANLWAKGNWKPEQFFHSLAVPKQPQTPDQMKEIMKAITALHGGTIVDKKD